MAEKILDGTLSKQQYEYKKNYPGQGGNIYFNTYQIYNRSVDQSGVIDQGTLKTFQLVKKGNDWYKGAELKEDGKWYALSEKQSGILVPNSDITKPGTFKPIPNASDKKVLGDVIIRDLNSAGRTGLRYQAINNSKFQLKKAGGLTDQQVNREFDISNNIAPPGKPGTPGLFGPAKKADEPTDPTDPTDPSPQSLQPPLTDEEFAGQFKNNDINYGVLRYPEKQYQEGSFDYLKINVLKYVKSGLIASGSNTIDLARPSERLKDILGTVILPMQPNISDSNGVSWNEDQLNVIQAAFASVALNSVNSAGQIQDLPDFMNWLKNNASNLGSTLGTLSSDPGLSNLIAGYFAGQAVGTNVMGRATGAVINNNLELLFQGPKLRTFRYSYRFTPRSKEEARIVKQIIRLFKREMSTSHSNNGLFLQTPNVFQLKYIYNSDRSSENGNQHPFLNKIKPCALTNFNVNYTPDGTYMTYADGGSMTSYAVDMEFSELEPIYKEDYDDGDDVNDPKSMGY